MEKTSRLVILQEAVAQCSFASEVAALVAEETLDCLDAPIRRVTALDTPMPFSPKLERFVVPSEERPSGRLAPSRRRPGRPTSPERAGGITLA